MEKLIKKWWFYLAILFLAFVPAISQKTFSYEQTTVLIQQVLENPIIYKWEFLFPVAKLVLIMLFVGPVIGKNKFREAFTLTFSILLLVVIFFQNISIETQFGYAILTGNILIQLVVFISWIYELRLKKNDFSRLQFNWWKILLLLMSFVSFWMPNDKGLMCFSISDILFNEAGLTFCMIIPVVLSILIIYYPNINPVTLRVTSFVGFYFGVVNMITWFSLNTVFWWMGILHLPLFIISFFGLFLSMRIKTKLHLAKNKAD